MPAIRKLVTLGLVALTLSAVAASAAPAVELRDATTSVALAAGDPINGATTTSATLTGSYFGSPWTMTCTSSAWSGSVTANAPAPAATLASLLWTSCRNSSGTSCTWSALNLPWTGAISFPSATQMSWAVPSNGGWQISGAGCLPLSTTCTYAAGQTLTFSWSNVAGGAATASLNQAVTSPTCGNATWTITYSIRRGSTPGSGNGVQLV